MATVFLIIIIIKNENILLAFTPVYAYIKASFANTNYLLPNSFYLWRT